MNHRSAPRLVELQKNMYASLHDNPENIAASTKWDEDDGIINLVVADNNNIEADVLAKTIFINGAIKEELAEQVVVAKFATVQKEGDMKMILLMRFAMTFIIIIGVR